MRRWLLLLVAAAAVMLAGCSGSRSFGVTTTPDGQLQVLSACDDTGLADVRVSSVGGDAELLVHLRPLAAAADLPDRVIVTAPPPTHEAVVSSDTPLSGTVQVSANYPVAATFTEDVLVDLDGLRPGVVATTAFEGTVRETRTGPLEDFMSARGSCRGWDVPLPVTVGVAAVVAVGGAAALMAIWRLARTRTSSQPSSTLPHPPRPPDPR